MNACRVGTCLPWRCSLVEGRNGPGGGQATPDAGPPGGPRDVPTLTCVFRDPQVNLYVADVEAMALFYREVLGFTETFRTPDDGVPAHVELRLGGFVLGVAGIEAARAMHGIDVGGDRPRAEVVLWTDDVDTAYAHAVASGARPLAAPHDFLGSVRAGWVADPEGNPVELVMRRAG